MKKFISLCLVITIIMSSLNPKIANALSNYVNGFESSDSIVNKSEVEKTDDLKDKESEEEKTDGSENKESEEEKKEDSKDNESDKKLDLEKPTISKKENESKDSEGNNKITIKMETGNDRHHKTLKEIFDYYFDNDAVYYTNTFDIIFNENYTITPEDIQSMRATFEHVNHITFTAKKDVTVTVEGDLKFHCYNKKNNSDLINYQPQDDSAKSITFKDIKLKFTDEHSIYANGLWLHFGENVKMEGDHYPKIFAGSYDSGNPINNQVRLFIESGSYSEISTRSADGGRQLKKAGTIYFFGGYAKEITSGKNKTHESMMYVKMYGGKVGKVIDSHSTLSTNMITINVRNEVVIHEIENVQAVTVGKLEINGIGKSKKDKLTITGNMKLIELSGMTVSPLLIGKNSILEIGKDVTYIKAGIMWFGDGSTIRVPGNRSKKDIPLILGVEAIFDGFINIELSTDIMQQEFYLLKVDSIDKPTQDKYRISEDQYFYLDKIEEEPKTDGEMVYYLKAKAKEKGPLIYDTNLNKFSYIDMKNKEQDAWWINEKIKGKELNLEKLKYNDLSKYSKNNSEYYVLAPSTITLRIRGSGSDNTFKFDNDRQVDRKFDIEFKDLNTSNSEFSFKNINSIIVSGANSITQDDDNKTALTYSFVGNSGDALTFTEDSSFVVYNKDDNDKYNIKDNIINDGSSGNTFIANMSFEDSVPTKKLQLHPMDSNDKPKKFSTKNGYDKISVLLPGDGKDYLLSTGDKTEIEGVYYYQTSNFDSSVSSQNSGPISTKFTFTPNTKKNYYKVNDKQRVYVIANQNGKQYYYLDNNLSTAMNSHVAHTPGSHEVVFLGNYKMTQTDAVSIKNHPQNTSGITFKTKVDDWKYILNVNEDIELKYYDPTYLIYPVTFDKIKFKYESPNKWIYANGRELIFGNDVEMEGSYYPSVSAGKAPKSRATVTDGKVTINSGIYKDVTGNSNDQVEKVNLTINSGIFNGEVTGINGGTANSATLTINNGTFNQEVIGINGHTAGSATLTINNGTFNGEVIGINGRTADSNNSTININGNISIPKVSNYDKLVVGSNNKSVLTITNIMQSGDQNGELIMKNSSELKLTGNSQSEVNKLTIDGSGNTLTLNMDKQTAPLKVKSNYNHKNQKLILNIMGSKADNRELIEFSTFKADVNNFSFNDPDYYIREIASGEVTKIVLCKKMTPASLAFKLDMSVHKLQYSIDGKAHEDVWWYKQANPSDKDLTFSKNNMFTYKGMSLFKNSNIASGDKVFEITNKGDNKNISLDLGEGTNFDFKLSNSNLTNSTIDAKNLKDLILDGPNSISEDKLSTEPVFSYEISGEVQASNDNSYLAIYTGKTKEITKTLNRTGKLAPVIDFKFNNAFESESKVRLAPNDGKSELSLTIPNGTSRLGILFGSSNNKTYNLYHGESGNTGTSVYVSGDTDKTFTENFKTLSKNNGQTYEYVRRANPVNNISVTIPNQIDFSVDTQTSGIDGINPDNSDQYFKAKDIDINNKSIIIKDQFTDKNGTTHNFGETRPTLDVGYLGVKPSGTIKNSIELVNKNELDPNITNNTNGVKMALKLLEGANEIPLDEKEAVASSPLKTWNISSGTSKKLKITPDFDSNKHFFNIDMNSPDTLNSSHKFIFRFGLKMP